MLFRSKKEPKKEKKTFVERLFHEDLEGEYDDEGFFLPQMAHFGTQMEYILIEKGMINMVDILMTMMNMSQEKVGTKKIIATKMN